MRRSLAIHADVPQLVRGAARRKRGFTLVELVVTIAVAAVLLAFAIPSFKSITLSNKLTTTANDFVAAINIARMESVKLNANVQLCSDSSTNNTSDTLGAYCSTQTAGTVVAMIGSNPTLVRTAPVGIATPLKLNGSMVALRFSGQGLAQIAGTSAPYNGLVADICTSSLSSDNHRLINMTTGSIIVTSTGPGACP